MNFSNFVVCSVLIAIFVIAIIPSDTVALRKYRYNRSCGSKRCNTSIEVCIRKQMTTNSSAPIKFQPTCVKSTELPKNVKGPCSHVLCLDGYTCALPRRKFFTKRFYHATCKISPVLGTRNNSTRST